MRICAWFLYLWISHKRKLWRKKQAHLWQRKTQDRKLAFRPRSHLFGGITKRKYLCRWIRGTFFKTHWYQCYRSKTFTDNDIRLHFILMDALEDNAMSVSEIAELYFCKLRHDNRRADNPYQAKRICKRGLGVGGQKRKKYPIHKDQLLCWQIS